MMDTLYMIRTVLYTPFIPEKIRPKKTARRCTSERVWFLRAVLYYRNEHAQHSAEEEPPRFYIIAGQSLLVLWRISNDRIISG